MSSFLMPSRRTCLSESFTGLHSWETSLVNAGILPYNFDFETHQELVGMQPGDVPITYADNTALEQDYGFAPRIRIKEGLKKFAEWYKEYTLS